MTFRTRKEEACPRFITVMPALGVVTLYSAGVTFVILKVLDKTVGLRVTGEHGIMGLDLSQHSEAGYDMPQEATARSASTPTHEQGKRCHWCCIA